MNKSLALRNKLAEALVELTIEEAEVYMQAIFNCLLMLGDDRNVERIMEVAQAVEKEMEIDATVVGAVILSMRDT